MPPGQQCEPPTAAAADGLLGLAERAAAAIVEHRSGAGGAAESTVALPGLAPASVRLLAHRVAVQDGGPLPFVEAPSESVECARALPAEAAGPQVVGHLRQRALLRSLIAPTAGRDSGAVADDEGSEDRPLRLGRQLAAVFRAPLIGATLAGNGAACTAHIVQQVADDEELAAASFVPNCLCVLMVKAAAGSESAVGVHVLVADDADSATTVTLRQCVDFAPAFLDAGALRQQLVAYQMVCSLRHSLQCGYVPRRLSLDSWTVDQRGRVAINPLALSTGQASAYHNPYGAYPLHYYTDQWCTGALCNYDYLTVLNAFAGRGGGTGSMCGHAIMPWVCDFTLPHGGWRDLTQSKYRLSKGDRAVEANYAGASPHHHVAEPLSDIAYCVYMARRLRKDTLTSVVRQQWVADEYPSSMRRLYSWTPDECIPEFYSDPQIFSSMHSDMADLECVSWASAPADFVQWHRRVLDCDFVAQRLNHWIDIMFGYKLCGEEAVLSKNVHLSLADRHADLRTHGTVQLFAKPHPVCNAARRPVGGAQQLHSMEGIVDCLMNPLYALANRPPTAAFQCDSEAPPASDADKVGGDRDDSLSGLLSRVYSGHAAAAASAPLLSMLRGLACALAQLAAPVHFRHLARCEPSEEHERTACRTAARLLRDYGPDLLPAFMREAIAGLLLAADGDGGVAPLRTMHQTDAVSPELLLQPVLGLLRHCRHAAVAADWLAADARLCHSITTLHMGLARSCEELGNEPPAPDSAVSLRRLCDERVRLYARYSAAILSRTASPSIGRLWAELGMDLFDDGRTSAAAYWSLFGPVARALGRQQSWTVFGRSLRALFDVEAPCTSKTLKLYHRTFQWLLVSRLGAAVYLRHVAPLLVEAASGERDHVLMADEQYMDMVRLGLAHGGDGVVQLGQQQWESSAPDSAETDGDSGASAGVAKAQFCVDLASSSSGTGTGNDGKAATLAQAAADYDHDSECDTSTTTGGGGECDDAQTAPAHGHSESAAVSTISSVAEDTLTWLCAKLNCVLVSKGLLAPLLRMLALCYWGDRLRRVPGRCADDATVYGDIRSAAILRCLEAATCIYGPAVITCQYLPFCADLMEQASRRLAGHLEGGLIGCVALLEHVFPLLGDKELFDSVQEPIVDSILFPCVRLCSSLRSHFADNRARGALAAKCANAMHSLAHRLGVDNVKRHIMAPLQRLLCTFDLLYTLDESAGGLKPVVWEEGATNGAASLFATEAVLCQLHQAFDPPFAQFLYDMFVPICGKRYFELSVPNCDLFAALVGRNAAAQRGGARAGGLSTPPVDLGGRSATAAAPIPAASVPSPQRQHYSAGGNRLSSSFADVAVAAPGAQIAEAKIRRARFTEPSLHIHSSFTH